MYRNYCDRCNNELNNTYWKTQHGKIIKTIEIKMDDETVIEMLLCEKCGKITEDEIFKMFDWFQKKEQIEAKRLEISNG